LLPNGIPQSQVNPWSLMVVGDSTALDVGIDVLGDANAANATPSVTGIVGCGVVGSGTLVEKGQSGIIPPAACSTWSETYQSEIDSTKPDVVLFLTGRWEEVTRDLNGTLVNLGQPSYDNLVESNLQEAIRILASKGATVVALTSPANFTGLSSTGGTWPEDSTARLDVFNSLVRQAVSTVGGNTYVYNYSELVTPNDQFSWSVGGVSVRSADGIHYSVVGGAWLGRWLVPVAWSYLQKSKQAG
ncbi:MAG: hypothetical protein HKL80_09610, partial [Acidimicrobiales bacterium]|nr:hypothetical protein [Acidimicrobiales bacterium]